MGWDSVHKIHLQHCTPRQLLDFGLVTGEEFEKFTKFSLVRNSYDRLLSAYFHMKHLAGGVGTLREFLTQAGPFARYASSSSPKYSRHAHWTNQVDFVTLDGHAVLDIQFSFEDLSVVEEYIISKAKDREGLKLGHSLRRATKEHHYSCYFGDADRALVVEIWGDELEYFGFDFLDSRSRCELAHDNSLFPD